MEDKQPSSHGMRGRIQLERMPIWLHLAAIFLAFLAAKASANAAGQMVTNAMIAGDGRATGIGAFPAALLSFSLVYGGFLLISRVFNQKFVILIIFFLIPIELLLVATTKDEVQTSAPTSSVVQHIVDPWEPSDTIAKPTPPPGYSYPDAPPPETPAEAAAQPPGWNSAALDFEGAHQELRLGKNAQIMQANIKRFNASNMTNDELLNKAYVESVTDEAWTPPAQIMAQGKPR